MGQHECLGICARCDLAYGVPRRQRMLRHAPEMLARTAAQYGARVATRTRSLFREGLRALGSPLAPEFYESLEELLIAGDVGPTLAARLSAAVLADDSSALLQKLDAIFGPRQKGAEEKSTRKKSAAV